MTLNERNKLNMCCMYTTLTPSLISLKFEPSTNGFWNKKCVQKLYVYPCYKTFRTYF